MFLAQKTMLWAIIMGSMSKSYPNRQTLVIGLICLVVVATTLVYIRPEFLSQKSSWKNLEVKPTSTVDTNQQFAEIAESDWKKAFAIATTTNNPDTNIDDKSLTLTDRLGRDFFTKYVELRQSNLSTDNQSVTSAMSQTINSTVNSAPKPKTYTMANMVVTDVYNDSTLRSYGNNIGNIFVKSGPRADPTTVAEEAMEKEDPTILEDLKPIINSYDKMTKMILATSVPRPLANYHLELINALSSMYFVSTGLQNLSTDPMQGIMALDRYVPARETISRALLNINNYFNKKEIYFSNLEPGFIFATVPQQ